MTTLFDLLGYETQTVIKEDGNDDYEDPAYITPPIGKATQPKPELLEPSPEFVMTKLMELFEIATNYDQHDDIYWRNSSEAAFTSKIHVLSIAIGGEEISPLVDPVIPVLKQFRDKFFKTAIAPNSKPSTPLDCSITSDIEDEIPTKKADPIPPDEPQTLKSGYIEEKTVRKNGKVVGVYLYQRWRENGKLKSKYLGSKPRTSAP